MIFDLEHSCADVVSLCIDEILQTENHSYESKNLV
jgi:hypothetical protein